MQKMAPSEIIEIVRSIALSIGLIGIVFSVAVFSEVHWGWVVFIAFIAIAVLQNEAMRNIGGNAK